MKDHMHTHNLSIDLSNMGDTTDKEIIYDHIQILEYILCLDISKRKTNYALYAMIRFSNYTGDKIEDSKRFKEFLSELLFESGIPFMEINLEFSDTDVVKKVEII